MNRQDLMHPSGEWLRRSSLSSAQCLGLREGGMLLLDVDDHFPYGHSIFACHHSVIGLVDELFERVELEVAEEDLRAFRLKENLPFRGEGVSTYIGQLSIHILPDPSILRDQFEQIPLAMRFF